MNPSSITRRSFIKRTATTAVAAAFAVGAFNAYSIVGVAGSEQEECFCIRVDIGGAPIKVTIPRDANGDPVFPSDTEGWIALLTASGYTPITYPVECSDRNGDTEYQIGPPPPTQMIVDFEVDPEPAPGNPNGTIDAKFSNYAGFFDIC